MKNEYQEIIEIDEVTKKFVPFRNRHNHWGDPTNRPLIPNVATIIPPDVDPELLPFLLYRMKLEELTYKSQHLDDQSINIVWTENKLDTYLFPNIEDALLSKAYECIRFEKHMLFQEIDKAIPAVLPPEIILSANTELPAVQHIKKNFKITPQDRDQESTIKEQSDEYEYTDSSDQQKELTDAKNEKENENYDQTYENEYYPQPSTSNKPFDNENRGYNPQSYNPPFNNPPKDILKFPKAPMYDDEEQRPRPHEFLDSVYNNGPPPPPPQIQPSKPTLPFQEPYSPPQTYSNPHYRYGQPEFDNYSSQKQQKMPPPLPPSFIQNLNPSSTIKIPPPPPYLPPKQTHPSLQQQQRVPPPPLLPRDFRPLPPPPPLPKNGPPQSNSNRPENGNQGSNQWNTYGNY